MKFVKLIVNPRVITALISAASALVCAVLAGCKLAGSFSVESIDIEIMPALMEGNK